MQQVWTADDIKPGVIVARCGFGERDYSRIEMIGYCPKLRNQTEGEIEDGNAYGVTDFADGMFVAYDSKAELAAALTERNARPLSAAERVLLFARFDELTEDWCKREKRQSRKP